MAADIIRQTAARPRLASPEKFMSYAFSLRAPAALWATVAAVLPTVAALAHIYGPAAPMRVALAAATAAATEWLVLRWRGKPPALADGSAVLAGCIVGVCLPPQSPWHVAVFAAAAGVGLAKHCYGGLGNNPFNPAMAGYALAFVCFPADFAAWQTQSGWQAAWQSLFVDAAAHPTPLLAARAGAPAPAAVAPLWLPAAAVLAGGLPLLALRVACPRLVCSFVLGACLATAAGGVAWEGLLHGGLLFAAFFVVTDPATAASGKTGRWLYGGLTGALAVWLRKHGAHADGIAFAVLAGNLFAGLCDFPERLWRRIRR